ncbi:EcsC family protein [Priestia abyssalis]|uniref:EcsC family protein n=1 Tax=Priestia abyssalis TaxID=1221450 RepID=UPI000994B341|nr:EcsC family protein [Priestia abyssalis]
MLTKRDELVLREIEEWTEGLQMYTPHELQLTYSQWLEQTISVIPEDIRLNYINKLDEWLFHVSSWLQDSNIQQKSKKQILTSARAFYGDVDQIEDLKHLTIDQLNYLAEQKLAKQRLYGFIQGGLTGTGSSLFMSVDMPVLVLLNLRTVQLAAMSYGYEINSPFELMLSLKVFHAASLPKQWQSQGWDYLMNELATHEHSFFYEGNEKVLDETWFEKNINQLLKTTLLILMKKSVSKRNPLLSMFLGGVMNYQFTRQTADYAKRFYQYRYLREKGRDFDES